MFQSEVVVADITKRSGWKFVDVQYNCDFRSKFNFFSTSHFRLLFTSLFFPSNLIAAVIWLIECFWNIIKSSINQRKYLTICIHTFHFWRLFKNKWWTIARVTIKTICENIFFCPGNWIYYYYKTWKRRKYGSYYNAK